ncbi:YbjN domain-containing protein [Corynebacterium mayonis]|uniref:YbjN domain-containing protein n=1 Tax=Corynebacterium mayonis TaxID=3062461 RepID=UPI00314016FE
MAFTPVTHQRIEALLTEAGLSHFRGDADGEIRTAFPGLVCFFQLDSVGFKVTTRWLATARKPKDVLNLRIAANELNRTTPLVRVHAVPRDDGSTLALFEAPFFTSGGVSDTQLRGMLSFYFTVIRELGKALEAKLPHILDAAVTEDTSDDDAKEKEF